MLFSFTIYNSVTSEVQERLQALQSRYEQPGLPPSVDPNHRLFSAFRIHQRETASRNIFFTLLYVNLLILLGGGVLSYLLARRTLHQIEESHNAQSRFTSDASHELRTPLAAMRSELEVAIRDPKMSKSEMRELLESNLEEVNELSTLSQTLLSLSKLDYASLEFEKVDMKQLVQEVSQKYDKNASRITLSLPKTPVFIHANQPSVEELLTIVTDNALKYSPQKSKIKVKLAASGRQAIYTISNGGKGIPAEKLPHIFDRFYRGDSSRTDGGSGLGLALAKEIVALHKGELSVSSISNKQTVFEIIFPLARKN